MQLQFFAEGEAGQFDEVDYPTALGFDDSVADWQGF
jgi:hypothetical protein